VSHPVDQAKAAMVRAKLMSTCRVAIDKYLFDYIRHATSVTNSAFYLEKSGFAWMCSNSKIYPAELLLLLAK